MKRRNFTKLLVWLPPLTCGVIALSIPLLRTGDVRSEAHDAAHILLGVVGLLYIRIALVGRAFRALFRLMLEVWDEDRRRREDRLRGLCPQRRYDLTLTGNLSGICPECGTPIK